MQLAIEVDVTAQLKHSFTDEEIYEEDHDVIQRFVEENVDEFLKWLMVFQSQLNAEKGMKFPFKLEYRGAVRTYMIGEAQTYTIEEPK